MSEIKDVFMHIKVSELRLDDKFMQHHPRNCQEEELKEWITDVISFRIQDFWCPKYAPSFTSDGIGICYAPGSMPAVDKKDPCCWEAIARKFAPERGSRLGTRLEYVAFLATLIKRLVAEGWNVEHAWYCVCQNSSELGHYKDSEESQEDFECTGSREVAGFYDLGNTFKLLIEDERDVAGYWLAGGDCHEYGDDYPISDLGHFQEVQYFDFDYVGWIVLEK